MSKQTELAQVADTITVDSGNVGIGTSSPDRNLVVNSGASSGYIQLANTASGTAASNGFEIKLDSAGAIVDLINRENGDMRFWTNNSEAMRIDSSGNLLVGKTAEDVSAEGVEAKPSGKIHARAADGPVLDLRRGASSSSELIATFRDDNTGMIKIGESGGAGFIEGRTGDTGLKFEGAHIRPRDNQVDADNAVDLGNASFRFDDIFATNTTISTSDQNEKQQIAALTTAEITAAKAMSQLFKTFKWNDRVAEKGDAARTHTGIIAQEVEQAMTDAGLSADNYAFFISTTWWETQTDVPAVAAVAEVLDDDGNVVTEAVEAQDAYTRTDTYETLAEAPAGATERTRKGIRYPELLSFVGAATEQRLADIETRLTALEAV